MIKIIAIFYFMLSSNYTAKSQKNIYHLYGGTTTINIITSDSILIAADGLQTQTDENGNITGHNTFSKIQSVDNIFFTFSGEMVLIRNSKKEIVFDAYKIMSKVLNECKDFYKGFESYNDISYKVLDSVFDVMPKNMLDNLKSKINQKLIEAVMVTYKDGKPVLKNWDFGFVNNNGNIEFKIIDKPYNGTIPYLFFTGHSAEIKKAISVPDYWGYGEKLQEKLIDLIKLEIIAVPHNVGFPIDVVTIFHDKAEKTRIEK